VLVELGVAEQRDEGRIERVRPSDPKEFNGLVGRPWPDVPGFPPRQVSQTCDVAADQFPLTARVSAALRSSRMMCTLRMDLPSASLALRKDWTMGTDSRRSQ